MWVRVKKVRMGSTIFWFRPCSCSQQNTFICLQLNVYVLEVNYLQKLISQLFASPRPASLWRKRIWHWCFPVNFEKFLRAPFLQNTSGWLLLSIKKLHESKAPQFKIKFPTLNKITFSVLYNIDINYTQMIDSEGYFQNFLEN